MYSQAPKANRATLKKRKIRGDIPVKQNQVYLSFEMVIKLVRVHQRWLHYQRLSSAGFEKWIPGPVSYIFMQMYKIRVNSVPLLTERSSVLLNDLALGRNIFCECIRMCPPCIEIFPYCHPGPSVLCNYNRQETAPTTRKPLPVCCNLSSCIATEEATLPRELWQNTCCTK